MTKQRTDTERLDWLEVTGCSVRRVDERGNYTEEPPEEIRFRLSCYPRHGKILRALIDSAMDAAENAQMDKAWKWFAASNCRLRFENNPHCDRNWECLVGPLGNSTVYRAVDRASAVLAAYLASGKEGM